jgi:NAD(P)-dependent dehydrogenase (short-subunit alcohol dehydrogenase family)
VTVDGHVAIVTGAAGGVGRAVVARFRAAGYRVVGVDIAATVDDLAVPGAVVPVRGDAGSAATAARAVEAARGEFGRLDVLVNNAGRFLQKPITEVTDEEFDGLIAANVRSAFVHSRAALPLLAESSGCVVNTASTSGFVGVAGQSVYAITKGALVQLTRALAIEYATRGVRVNAVAPGAIDTDFTAAHRAADPDPERSRRISLERHPIGRFSSADEVARAVEFLADPGSAGITGTILSVDGGYLAR